MLETYRRESPRTGPPPWRPPQSPGSADRSLVEMEVLSTAVTQVAREVEELQIHLRELVDVVSDQAQGTRYRSTTPPGSDSDSRDAVPRPALKTGSTVGPYRVLTFIRAGGMGEIYRAVDERLDRTVAIKVLPHRLSQDRGRRERLHQEARLLSSISHPHICTLFDVGHQAGREYLVMEYLEGRTLQERLAEGPLLREDALRIALDVADALEAAHSIGIVHRDLKPSNIMLTGPTDSSPGVKLLDFGLAQTVPKIDRGVDEDSDECTTRPFARGLEGTLPYMAPEQFDYRGPDSRTDIWALGVILYEMVCGRRPFVGKNPASIIGSILRSRPTAPVALQCGCRRDLSRTIERCLAKNPEQRWPTCRDLSMQMRQYTAEGAVQQHSDPRPRRPWRLLSRLKIAVATVFTLLALGTPTAAMGDPLSPAGIAPSRELESREHLLLNGQISDIQRLDVGVTGSARALVTWQGRSHAAHIQSIDSYVSRISKATNLRDYYRYNVAAYRLDRLLNLSMVPVSVERTIRRQRAAVTWWVDNVKMMELERRERGIVPPDRAYWNNQMQRVHIFQELIWDSDANQSNILITDDWRIWIIDFTRAFRGYRKLQHPDRLRRIDRPTYDALRLLDEETLWAEMKGLLIKSQVRAILARRDRILELFDAKIDESGAEKVIYNEPQF